MLAQQLHTATRDRKQGQRVHAHLPVASWRPENDNIGNKKTSCHTHMTHLGISVAHSRQKACLQGSSRPCSAIGTWQEMQVCVRGTTAAAAATPGGCSTWAGGCCCWWFGAATCMLLMGVGVCEGQDARAKCCCTAVRQADGNSISTISTPLCLLKQVKLVKHDLVQSKLGAGP